MCHVTKQNADVHFCQLFNLHTVMNKAVMNIALIETEEESLGVDEGSLLAGKSEKRQTVKKTHMNLCYTAVSKMLHLSLKC